MVKEKRIDVEKNKKTRAEVQVLAKKKQKDALAQMEHFVIGLAAATGDKFRLVEPALYHGDNQIASQDIVRGSWPRRKRIGSIRFESMAVDITLKDESIEEEFSKQVSLFEKKLQKDGFLGSHNHINYIKAY
jgi:cellulase/cellobiase CelA1